MESEKIHVLYYREWADALPELFKDFPDDNAKREKIDFAQKLKKIPTEVVEEICDQYNNAIIAGFEENNLEEINLLELGSSKAHKILYSSYYEKLLHSISKMSKKVQY